MKDLLSRGDAPIPEKKKKSKGAMINAMNLLGQMKIDIGGMLGDFKSFVPRTVFNGTGGVHWHEGMSMLSVMAEFPCPPPQLPKALPIKIKDWSIKLGPTTKRVP